MRIVNCEWRIADCGLRRPSLVIRQIHLLVVCCLLLSLLVAGCGSQLQGAFGGSRNAEASGPIVASGFIEGEEVTIAPEVGGRIAEMGVDRGDAVQAGKVLVRLDGAVLQTQRLEAEAGLAAARANLARVKAGVRPEEISAARAALARTQAELDGAAQAVINARDAISNPLMLDAEISAARTQVSLAEQNVEMAEANLAEAELRYNALYDQGGDVRRALELQLKAAQAALAQAEAELEGAKRYLGSLWAMRANPLALQAQLHGAEMGYNLAEAQVEQAQATLDRLKAGPTEEEVALAEAQVRQAQAAVGLIDAQLEQLVLRAPMDGIVTSRSAQAGETATAGGPLLTIANLDEVRLVLYVPENRIGQVRVGGEVEVQVDSFSGRTFVGQVTSIGGEAEFTPRNVQTKEERVNLVFAVKVRLPNADHALKPGMPADATFRP